MDETRSGQSDAERPRVLLVEPEIGPSGRIRAFARLGARIAVDADVRWVIGYRGPRGALPGGALGVALPEGSWRSARALRRAVAAIADRFDPAVVVVRGLFGASDRPTIAVVRDRIGTGWAPLARVDRLARSARAIVVPCDAVRRDLVEAGLDPWRIERIPDGATISEQRPPPAPRPPGAPLRLVHPGTIHPAKGQHVSVDAVARLPAPVRGQVALTIAGPAGDERYLAQLRAAARGLPVAFEIGEASAASAVAAAHLAVYPTALPEGFPDAAVAAMAAGRAVIYAAHASVAEAIAPAGLPVPPSDTPALRDAIAEVAAGGLDIEALGERAWATARDRFDWSRLWPRWRMALFR